MNDRNPQQKQAPLEDSAYIVEITGTLRDLLRQVIKAREPDVLTILDNPGAAAQIPEHLVEHALQAIGIWLQLMNIAEENASIRNRRDIEKQGGPDQVIGSFSHAVAQVVEDGTVELGILLCGSANGVNITANKHHGVRSAIAWNEEVARLAREHNNANVLALPARFVEEAAALRIVDAFLAARFEGGRHQRRVEKIEPAQVQRS